MMTTMTALVGTLPTALGLGAGAESRVRLDWPWLEGCWFRSC
jgi:multidrug efflux pump subunit AcrB